MVLPLSQILQPPSSLLTSQWLLPMPWSGRSNPHRTTGFIISDTQTPRIAELEYNPVKIGYATDCSWLRHGIVRYEGIKKCKREVLIPRASDVSASDFANYFPEPQTKWLLEMANHFVEKLKRAIDEPSNLTLHNSLSITRTSHGGLDKNDWDASLRQILDGVISLSSIYLYAAAVAFGGGISILLFNHIIKTTNQKERISINIKSTGCLLIMRPTPFNRFVMMRCPSVTLEEADTDALSNNLALDGRPFLETDGNRFFVLQNVVSNKLFTKRNLSGRWGNDDKPVYQRTYLHAEDGGVLAIDWPSDLDLIGEHGLDTTFILVPGTPAGSGDVGVQNFVLRSRKCGYFPVVLNPRGCAGSMLTTPRLFTAADSDDVRLAVKFILKSRPSTTLMAVGWGYGANMLVKYLAEEAEATPLTGAVCIGNPFDLEEATKTVMHGNVSDLDQNMVDGYKQILQMNKMLFEGMGKRFDIEKGLTAVSVREFDAVISKVAHGLDTLEEFYERASSKSCINEVKIPLLCMQSDDQMSRSLSTLCETFEENPFTFFLLTCSRSFLDRKEEKINMTLSPWYCTFIIEWLAAVELAFLKGRHPLLQGVGFTIKPPKEWDVSRRQLSHPSVAVPSEKQRTSPASVIGAEQLAILELKGNYQISNMQMGKSGKGMLQVQEIPDQTENQGESAYHIIADRQKIISDKDFNPVNSANIQSASTDGETEEAVRGQAQQVTESVMRGIDVTMPGTLTDEKKQQVLDAVGRGETIVTALQTAVPEDVRGKIAAAVSGVLQAKGVSLNLAGLGKGMPAARLPEDMKVKIQENLAAVAQGNISKPSTGSADAGSNLTDSPTEDPCKGNQHEDGFEKNIHFRVPTGDLGTEATQDEEMFPVTESVGPKLERESIEGRYGDVLPEMQKKYQQQMNSSGEIGDHGELGKTHPEGNVENLIEMMETNGQEINTIESGVYVEQEKSNQVRDALIVDDKPKQEGSNQDHEKQHKNVDIQVRRNSQAEENDSDMQQMQKDEIHNRNEDTVVEGQLTAAGNQEGQNKQITGAKGEEQLLSQNSAQSSIVAPSISVQHALEALTGFDESAQMAVTNVFGVIESMIEQIEKDNQKEQNAGSQLKNDEPQPSVEKISNDEGFNKPERQAEKKNSPIAAAEDFIEESAIDTASSQYEHLDSSRESRTKMQTTGIHTEHNVTGFMDSTKNARISTPVTGATISGSMNINPGNKLSARYSDESIHGEMFQEQNSKLHMVRNRNVNAEGTSLKVEDQKLDKRPNQHLVQKESDNPPRKLDSKDHNVHGDVPLEYCPNEEVWKFASIVGSPLENDTPSVQEECHQVNKHEEIMNHKSNQCGGGAPKELNSPGITGSHGPTTHQVHHATSQVVEAAYVILDDESNFEEIERLSVDAGDKYENGADSICEGFQLQEPLLDQRGYTKDGLQEMVQYAVIDALKLESLRRLGLTGMDAFGYDLEEEITKLATAVVETIIKDTERMNGTMVSCRSDSRNLMNDERGSGKLGLLNREAVICTISFVLNNTNVLRRLIPFGVLVGVILAALDTFFLVTDNAEYYCKDGRVDKVEVDMEKGLPVKSDTKAEDSFNACNQHGHQVSHYGCDNRAGSDLSQKKVCLSNYSQAADVETKQNMDTEMGDHNNGTMTGAMSAAVCSTTALAHEGSKLQRDSISGSQETININKKLKDNKPNIMSSFAEKAMSVAAPVVPTKKDGEVDHERLVAILADLGQKGGILHFIGKVALLWGGLRGAVSLTERLLVFLRLSQRPLHQRLAGFLVMALLLWSPVLVPLLPTLLQQWASKSPSTGVAECVCFIGLYGAIIILVTIWGKTIRGYDQPLAHYGLRLFSKSKFTQLAGGLAIGCILVSTLYGIGSFLSLLQFTRPGGLSSFAFKTLLSTLEACWSITKLVGKAFGTGLTIATIEELIFRSWLQEEIATDLGFHKAIVLSGLVFSLLHWSLQAVPGLWLLSLALSAAKIRSNGELSLPIGIHSGLIAGNYIFVSGGFIKYAPNAPSWIIGAHIGNPLAGALGSFMVGILALALYPWEHVLRTNHLDELNLSTKVIADKMT